MHDWEGAEQMEMIYNWILKLSFFAVLGSVILQMIPDHGFQKYVRFLLGLILAAAATNLLGYAASPSVGGIIFSVTFSIRIGVFFGYYPANKAAKMNPIEALRYE